MRIVEYVRYVLEIGEGLPIECPKWPADVFAVCCSILDRSGATADGRSNDPLMGGPVFSSLFYIGLKPR
ncbi:MAG: hypothetical protein ACK449_17260 [Planctomycetota bacterium]|jgi:hypothetical protein